MIGGDPGTPTSVADIAEGLGVIVDHVVTPLAGSLERVAVR